jgi:hypothetical protein
MQRDIQLIVQLVVIERVNQLIAHLGFQGCVSPAAQYGYAHAHRNSTLGYEGKTPKAENVKQGQWRNEAHTRPSERDQRLQTG